MIVFEIPGKPVGKQRPRTFVRDGQSRTITPQKTKDYEDLVRTIYQYTRGGMLQGAISVSICINVQPPKSFTKAKTEQALSDAIKPLTKPDLDNVAKSILDALNGFAYKDDSQVCWLSVTKRYAKKDSVVVSVT